MHNEGGHGRTFASWSLFFCCAILVVINTVEMSHIITYWKNGVDPTKTLPLIFNTCIKYDLISRTIYSMISCATGLSLCILAIFLFWNIDYFTEKLLVLYLYFNYLLLGPYLLIFCIFGFAYWNQIMYVCDKDNFNLKVLVVGNVFSFIGCLIFSLLVTCSVGLYKIFLLYVDSILRKPDGSVLIRKIFWTIVLKNRSPIEFLHYVSEVRNTQNIDLNAVDNNIPNANPNANNYDSNFNSTANNNIIIDDNEWENTNVILQTEEELRNMQGNTNRNIQQNSNMNHN